MLHELETRATETELTSKGMEQFLGYLSDNRVQSLNNIVYVFNAKKSSLQAAKQKMQKVFQGAKANDIFNAIYPKMATNLGLNLNNATTARQQYNTLITNLDEKIFSFIIIN